MGALPSGSEPSDYPRGTKVLVLSLAGAADLGFSLEATLRTVGSVEVEREDLAAVSPCRLASAAARLLTKSRPNLLTLCVTSESAGMEGVFGAVGRERPDLSVIVMLEKVTPPQLQQLFAFGAADFCVAPFRLGDLLPRLERWASPTSPECLVVRDLEQRAGFQQFLGRSQMFLNTLSMIPKLARCDANVVITGETGTGKEMCARAIHHLGPRAAHAFVPVNCGAIPPELMENELFGHNAGAYTSASSAAEGLVHEAEGGTLFLDEIDALALPMQVKLLRFLQDFEYRPLGAGKVFRADLRVIAASNADLEECVRARRFRSDLFYRLNVLPLKLPALRDRREDIPLLARHFAAKFAREHSTSIKPLLQGALEKLVSYLWPGNIRELQNIIERAIIVSEQAAICEEDICLPTPLVPTQEVSFKALKRKAIIEFETDYIRQVLAANEGNISRAARAARKNRRSFWQLMRKYGIGAFTERTTAWPEKDGQTGERSRIDLS
jgi:two-component system response regulator GlrR